MTEPHQQLHQQLEHILKGLSLHLPDQVENGQQAYDVLNAAFALGEWDVARDMVNLLREMAAGADQELLFDLTVHEAQLDAIDGNLESALHKLEPWEDTLNNDLPGYYENRVALVYQAAEDYPGFLRAMAESSISKDPNAILEYALAEARFGDIEHADTLLHQVSRQDLPDHADALLMLTRGIIALYREDEDPIPLLAGACLLLSRYAHTASSWLDLMLAATWYAHSLDRAGYRAEAEWVIEKLFPIILVHADPPLLERFDDDIFPEMSDEMEEMFNDMVEQLSEEEGSEEDEFTFILNEKQGRFMEEAVEEYNSKLMSLDDRYGLGHHDWAYDKANALFHLCEGEQILFTADVQVLGHFSREDGSWEWAWHNPLLPEEQARDARLLREYGQQEQIEHFTTGRLYLPDDEITDYFAALTVKLADAQGAYRADNGEWLVYLILHNFRKGE